MITNSKDSKVTEANSEPSLRKIELVVDKHNDLGRLIEWLDYACSYADFRNVDGVRETLEKARDIVFQYIEQQIEKEDALASETKGGLATV